MNTFVTPVWIYREGLLSYFRALGFPQVFLQKIRTMTDAEVERLNERVCKALSRTDSWNEDE